MSEQRIVNISDNYQLLDDELLRANCKKIMVVCDEAFCYLKISEYIKGLEERTGIKVIFFDDFTPNPLYESVVNGVNLLHKEKCDLVLAIGGGSAIDVAKCIKLYSNMNREEIFLTQKILPNDLLLYAIPTTAGTGSEATRYAVIYYDGDKQSVTDYSCIPSVVMIDISVLKSLPLYQKKSTMLDALCHALESFWSANSNEESMEYSKEAIQIILHNYEAYLKGNSETFESMLRAANIAGKAINITQTTAGHAMCYKLTSLYGISHGHAAALCVSKLWPFMVANTEKCIDKRGKKYLDRIFLEIASAFFCKNVDEAIEKFNVILEQMEMEIPAIKERDYKILRTSVNPIRLRNNPIALSEDAIDELYHQILQGYEEHKHGGNLK